MEIIFVRHGETEGNRTRRHQRPDTPLNPRGREQALAVAHRLRRERPTRIIASPYTRAFETAQIIGAELGLPVVTHEAFVELKRPSYIFGGWHFSPRSLWYITSWFFLARSPRWRAAGGESYEEFITRIRRARAYLESFEGHERVLIVSHSIFINFFVEHVCRDVRLTLFQAFLRLAKIVRLDNSSLTHVHFERTEHPNLCTWTTLRFDDDAHVVT